MSLVNKINMINKYFINFTLIFIFFIGKPATYFKIFSDNIYLFDLIFLFLVSINFLYFYKNKSIFHKDALLYFLIMIYVIFRLETINFFSLKNSYIFISISWYFLMKFITSENKFNYELFEKAILYYPFFSIIALVLTRQDVAGLLQVDLPFNEINLFSQKYNYILIKTGLACSYIYLVHEKNILKPGLNIYKISILFSIVTLFVGITQSRLGFIIACILIFLAILKNRKFSNIFKLSFLGIAIGFSILPVINHLTSKYLIDNDGRYLNNLSIACSYEDFYLFYNFEIQNISCSEIEELSNKKGIDLGRVYFRKFNFCSILDAFLLSVESCNYTPTKIENFTSIKNENSSSIISIKNDISSAAEVQTNSITWRFTLWETILSSVSNDINTLLFGIGFDKSIPKYFGLDTYYIDTAHNSYISLVAWSGLFGLSLFLIISYLLIKKAISAQNSFIIVLFSTAFLVAGIMDQTFETPSNSILFWCIIGINSSKKAIANEK